MTNDIDEHPLICSLRESVQQANADLSSLHNAAKILASRPAEVADFLVFSAQEHTIWKNIADHSYCHPNGFTKFLLYVAAGSLFRLRLHVWTGDHAQVLLQEGQNVHGHRWNFGSAIVAGPRLQIDEYVESDTSGTPYQRYAYKTDVGASDTGLEPTGQALLEPSVSYALATHETYVCGIDRLHTVRSASSELTATIIVQGPVLLPSAPVFRRFDQEPQAGPQPMAEIDARRVFDATIDAARRWLDS